jgi:hypothetical protein
MGSMEHLISLTFILVNLVSLDKTAQLGYRLV